MFASLKTIAPIKTGKDSSAPAGCLFPLEVISDTLAVGKILSQFPTLPPKILIALAVANMLARSVTPQRTCECGCGAFVTGKAKSAGPACRKRLERAKRRAAGQPGRQFNLVMQDEFPVKIPTLTPGSKCYLPKSLNCDNCGKPTYPHWCRCIHCAHYFCSDCQSDHGCCVKFKSAEQIEAEQLSATPPANQQQLI